MNGPILNFEEMNIVNIVKISQISLTALIRPRAALMLGLAPHPGRPLSSDLAPALVITLRLWPGYLLVDI